MSEIIKLQKSGKCLILKIPESIAENFNLTEDSQVEIEPVQCGGKFGCRLWFS
ncbi:MAG: hypothetical protein O8C58_02945 [Candidatus Methanoperedens sp.]|nr:hypothetical protein [Candidatus Methanoperedens sp.]MCZ7372739.1 hypothetical protein [Candidatus Methanoperedens sp.]MCZ7396904.1 hypothetical protein [Candidatus Methanoperedens sp.]